MKDMEYYVKTEPDVYSSIFKNRYQLLKNVLDEDVDQLNKYESVVIFATGSSSNAAYSAVPFMNNQLQIPVFVEEPSFSASYSKGINPNTLYIAISQGGHSYSTIHMVETIQQEKGTIYTLTSDLNSPIAKVSEHVIDMGMGIEEMPYVTLGYSSTILILDLLALEIAKKVKTSSDYEKNLAEIELIIGQMPKVIEHSEKWAKKYLEQIDYQTRIIFIGYGSGYGVSREGETKVTETVRMTAFGKELEEYMHGPYLGLHEDDQIVFIEPQGLLEERADKLKDFLKGHVPNVTTLYKNNRSELNGLDLVFNIDVNELLASLFMTIPIHLLSFKASQIRNINLNSSAFPEFDEITKSKI